MANSPKHIEQGNNRELESLIDLSNEDLVAKCLDNYRPAWEEFFRRFVPIIKDAIKRELDSELAWDMDIVTDIYLLVVDKLYKKGILRNCNNPAGVEAWLKRVAENQTKDWFKARKRNKRLPQLHSETVTVSLSTSVGNNESDKTLADFVASDEEKLSAGKQSEQHDKIDQLHQKIFDQVTEIDKQKKKWVVRLSLISYQALSEKEICQLIEFSPLISKEVVSTLDHMMQQVEEKEIKKENDQAKAILLWYFLRKIEAKLYAMEMADMPEQEQERIALQEKLQKKNTEREKLLMTSKKDCRPSNKDIAILVGIPAKQQQQITNILKRANKSLQKKLPQADW